MTAYETIQSGPYPEPSDAPDGPNQIKAVVDWAAGRLNMRFASTTTRDAAITTPVEGMRCTTGTGTSAVDWVYRSGAWVDVTVATAWSTWSPSFTNLTVGNGSLSARWRSVGGMVDAELDLTFGSTTSISSIVYFTLPVSPSGTTTLDPLGVMHYGNGSALYLGSATRSGSTARTHVYNGTSTSSSSPFTWASGSKLSARLRYAA